MRMGNSGSEMWSPFQEGSTRSSALTSEDTEEQKREHLTMETGLLQRFIQLITAHTGLQIRGEETDKLCHTIRSRMTEQQLINPEAYYQLLDGDTAASRHEWAELILPLTIGESYFFRDSGQFSLLRQHVIPELIERNSATRSLRIWSAGCSTGEEPYSLAILLYELLPTHSNWNIVIVGTDVNKRAIAAAQRGIYRHHSLRTLDPALRNRYFHQHRGDWELDSRFRSMVSFRQVNLLKDPFPDSTVHLADIDLILCRNVFIYFDRAAVTRVVSKFTKTLQVGGYLITGHAELHDQKLGELSVKTFSESVIYRREKARSGASQTIPVESRAAHVPSMTPSLVRLLERSPSKPVTFPQPQSSTSPRAKISCTVPPTAADSPTAQATSVEDLYSQASGYADVGHYEAAIRSCQLALIRDAFAEKPYHLLAQIAEMQGNITGAKEFLKKMLYVAPTSVVAHLDLGALYAREQDLSRAWKMYINVIELLKALPPDTIIEPFVDLPASQLLLEIQRRIEQLGAPSYTLG
jgi:chemotaxis protein methyltransferase CheR